MILLTLSRGKGEETVRLQLPASPAEIGEAFASLDRISLDTTATAILDVSSNVPVLYRCLYDVDVEDSEQFQKLQKLAERTEALSPAKAAIRLCLVVVPFIVLVSMAVALKKLWISYYLYKYVILYK